MTMAQVAELRVKWKQRVDPLPCHHLNLELEWNNSGYLTGKHHCTVCGESVIHKHQQSLP
jgi:hypothetical protein